jgi:23S rRNA (uracil1939-C5)-methyltransferase
MISVEIERLTLEGLGVAHHEGKTLFVPDALPGERVEVAMGRRHARYDEARPRRYLRRSVDRKEPVCPHFGSCGGCALQMLDPAAQIRHKTAATLEVLERIGQLCPEQVDLPVTGQSWSYRRRARLHCEVASGGRLEIGYRTRGGRSVFALRQCPILVPALAEWVTRLGELLDPIPDRRALSGIELASGDQGPAARLFARPGLRPAGWRALGARLAALGLPVEEEGPVEGSSGAVTLRQSYRLDEFDCEIAFRVADFIQVHEGVNRSLVRDLVVWADPSPAGGWLDLYAGVGNFSLPLARRAGSVIAVEGHPGSCETLRHNIRRNGLPNVHVAQADLSRPLEGLAVGGSVEGVVLDPPRSGAASVLEAFSRWRPERLLYVSCHPATLARDAARLVRDLGYRFIRLRTYDMFPQTAHLECLALFVRA